jgi:hypothetical protein
MPGGGDTRTPGAKQKIAQREEQIEAAAHQYAAALRQIDLRIDCQVIC